MLLKDVLAYQRRRLCLPWVWGPILGLGLVMGTLSGVATLSSLRQAGASLHVPALLSGVLGGLSVLALYFWLSPAPWLWSGTRASHAPVLRGALQALAFNSAVIGVIGILQSLLLWRLRLELRLGLLLGSVVAGVLIHGIGAALLGYFITLWERTKAVKEETEKKLREAHWVLLRGQLSPHALFNTLNGLAELVHVDPKAAEKGILDLAALYRSLLDHGSRPSAPLGDERILVERFLAIEQMRLGGRLQVEWAWNEALSELCTPPFLVQPLVENALKHGIAPCREGGSLHVGLREEAGCLLIRVENTGRPLPLVLGNGVGVRNLEGRLYLAYGDRARLSLRGEGPRTVAEIRVDMELLEEDGMSLRVALADDEPLARARLGRLLREAGCEVVAEHGDGPAVLAWLEGRPEVDALFLDIQMPGVSGLEVLAELQERPGWPPVVFVTAFSEHAVRAFEAAAADYILKPVSAERLEKSLQRLRGAAPRASDARPAGLPQRFPVKAGEGHVFLELKRTTHFEVEEEVVYAWSAAAGKPARHRTDWTSLSEVEEAFPGAGLVRIQRHLLLRPEAVLGLRPLEGGRAAVRVAEGLDLEVSRSVTPRLKERLGL